MTTISIKHHWLSGWTAPPAPTRYIVTNQFPMTYLTKPEPAKELISKVERATITLVANEFPLYLIKKDTANELRSKWS